MDARLQELMEQKKAIECEIKMLKKQATIYGYAKLDKEHFATDKEDEWYVAIWSEYHDDWYKKDKKEQGRWRSVIRHPDKDYVIKKIPYIIESLQELLKKLKESED